MLELFVLGELADKPMHGYLLHRILTNILGPLRPVSWGSFYPILGRLKSEGLIREVPMSEPGPGRPRKVYVITKSGFEEFQKLMAKPLEHRIDAEDIFRIKLSKFHLVSRDLQRDILWQYKILLEMLLDTMDLTRQKVEAEEHISDQERPRIVAVIAYDRYSHEARLQWVSQQLSAL